MSVIAIIAIPMIMTISMHGNVLALASVTPVASVGGGYQLTVNVPSYPSGTSTLGISITTANGYTDHANVAASGVTSWTFNIPANQGWVRVCVDSDISSGENCNRYDTTGGDMSVSLSPPSGDSNRYYVYPGNTYYIYPGYRHDYNLYHDRDHGYGGHEYDRDHWLGGHQDSGNNGNGGHQDSGNIGNGGNQDHGVGGHHDTGNIGNGGHQDSGNIGNGGNQNGGNNGAGGIGGHHDSGNNWFGGHENSGNHGVGEPVHHTSNGEPMINAESSDDD
ncbi:MAG: hypothetical protein WBZ36_29835 [Candidatus Nitrosopolaris sp.]